MCCPKCGAENLDDAKSCSSCGQVLTDTSRSPKTTDAKTSGLAIAALFLWIFSIPAFFLTEVLAFSVDISAIILGIVALIKIKQSSGRLKGRGLALAGIAVSAVMLFVLHRWPPVWSSPPHGPRVSQKNQFHSIDVALEMFRAEFDGYPPSDALDPISRQYCGAMKLAEALMGQDLLGFHQDSIFRNDGQDGSGRDLYPENPYEYNLKARKEHYLPLENANAYELQDLYANTAGFKKDSIVLCDVYSRVRRRSTGKRSGMPILYYKADTSKTAHNLDNPDDPNNIYNYRDNHTLVGLGVPWDPNEKHPLFTDPKIFYEITRNKKVKTKSSPHRADSFILISAGYDGLYGTKDDIFNFDIQWRLK